MTNLSNLWRKPKSCSNPPSYDLLGICQWNTLWSLNIAMVKMAVYPLAMTHIAMGNGHGHNLCIFQ